VAEDAEEVAQVRLGVESMQARRGNEREEVPGALAVRVAAERAEPTDIAALDGLLRRQSEVVAQNDYERFSVLDDEFHAAICELSRRGFAWEVAQRAKGHLSRVRRLSLPQPNYLQTMVSEHHAVLEALRRGSPDDAEQALRHHLRMVLSGVPALRLQHPDYFEDDEEGTG